MTTHLQVSTPTLDFIRQHQKDDVRQLAFLGSKYPEVDMPFALDQIRGRQMAAAKLPKWAATEGIVYPPHISMEQCSSEPTALYKAALAVRVLGSGAQGASFIDLTGGFGVDFSYIAAALGGDATYVERQAHLCEMARNNFGCLELNEAKVVCGDGIEVLHELKSADLIFIDPARRDDVGRKVVGLADCTPNVLTLKQEMLAKARYVLVKLSPMLDWHKAVADLGDVREVHIVAVANECKELLLLLSSEPLPDGAEGVRVYCANDGECFVWDMQDAPARIARVSLPLDVAASPLNLYEPYSVLMKAGCFAALSDRYGVEMLGRNSHLFVGHRLVADFPGRKFLVKSCTTLNKRELKQSLRGVDNANIAVRNFPMSVQELRKRLKLKDGGKTYLFATTLENGEHVLFVTEKV